MLKSLRVALGSSDTRFSAALGSDRRISVTGTVKAGQPYLTRIGTFDVDLALRGNILLVRSCLATSQSKLCASMCTVGAPDSIQISICAWICCRVVGRSAHACAHL